MADNLLPSVGAVTPVGDNAEAARGARAVTEMPQVKFEAALSQAEAKPEAKVENKPDTKAKDKDQTAEAAKAAKQAPVDTFHNVRLHFRVDPKTHEVTVLMVDKSSKRVIRSIPPEELGKLQEGDLVELFA